MGILRSKGFVWIAANNYEFAEWGHVGRLCRITLAGVWFVCLPREDWPEEAREAILEDFATAEDGEDYELIGDRRQEIVIIGDQRLDECCARAELKKCLLTDEEYALGPQEWAKFENPFAATCDVHADHGHGQIEGEGSAVWTSNLLRP